MSEKQKPPKEAHANIGHALRLIAYELSMMQPKKEDSNNTYKADCKQARLRL